MKRMFIGYFFLIFCIGYLGFFSFLDSHAEELQCGTSNQTIFTNGTSGNLNVTVRATDKCEGSTSSLELLDGQGSSTKKVEISDNGVEQTVTFEVPPGGIIRFTCNGAAGGNCPFKVETPTAIELISFTTEAAGDDGNVTLRWETATEVDNAGFDLYRAKYKNGAYTKINDTLIPAKGAAVSGANYSFIDTPPSRGTYYYKLEDVDYYGIGTMHGPEKVRVRSGHNASRRR